MVTEKGQKFRAGGNTKYIEHLSNGTLVIRQNDRSAQIQYTIDDIQSNIHDAQSDKINIIVPDKNKPITYKFASELEKCYVLSIIKIS